MAGPARRLPLAGGGAPVLRPLVPPLCGARGEILWRKVLADTTFVGGASPALRHQDSPAKPSTQCSEHQHREPQTRSADPIIVNCPTQSVHMRSKDRRCHARVIPARSPWRGSRRLRTTLARGSASAFCVGCCQSCQNKLFHHPYKHVQTSKTYLPLRQLWYAGQ